MNGIYIPKSIEKAIEIFNIGNENSYSSSMYNLGLIYERSNLKNSLQMYKKTADQGHLHAQEKLGNLLHNKDFDLATKYHKKDAEKGRIIAKEFLAKKYLKENDSENTYIYIHSLIETGNYSVPFEYAQVSITSLNISNKHSIYFLLLHKEIIRFLNI